VDDDWKEKGYALVGSNSAGNNAYFVKKDRLGNLRPLTAEAGYVESRFRESRDPSGHLTFLGGDDRLAAIGGMEVYHLELQKNILIKEMASLKRRDSHA